MSEAIEFIRLVGEAEGKLAKIVSDAEIPKCVVPNGASGAIIDWRKK